MTEELSAASVAPTPDAPTRGERATAWVCYWPDVLLIATWVVLVRLPSLPASVIDWDESLYILAGRAVLHGHLPYLAVFDTRPPGTPLLFAAALAVFGQTVVSVRLLGMICVTMTSLALRGIALRVGLSRGAAFATALLYPAYTAIIVGLPTNLEIVFAPFTAWAFWVAANPVPPVGFWRQARLIATAGVLIGLGMWIKYLPALPGCMLFAMLVGSWLWRGRTSMKAAGGLAIIYAACCLLPTLVSAAVYLWAGRWNEFWFCNFGFMSTYIGFGTDIYGLTPTDIVLDLLSKWPLLVGAAVAVVLWRDRPAIVTGAMLWLAAEVLAIIAPDKYYSHYFLILLPPLCLLAGCALDSVVRRFVVLPLGTIACLGLSLSAAAVPLVAAAGSVLRHQLSIRQPDTYRQVAAVIRDDPDPHPTAWVVNSQPIVYFLAGLPVPSRFVLPTDLVSGFAEYTRVDPMSRVGAATEVRRILGTRPRYLVVDPAGWTQVWPELRPLIRAAIDRDYTLLAQVHNTSLPIDIYRRRSDPR